jgi:anti-anti-sigma regulatory factor
MGPQVPCDVRRLPVDAATVDALARLQLAAKRRGCRIGLCNAPPALLELIELMGLTEVLVEPDEDRTTSR